jgi:hypothetical protein
LMCHMYDSPLFLQDHTLLSMSARPTQLVHSNMSLKHPEYKKNQKILQASMINPVLFSNTRLNDFKFDQSELEFLDLIENLGPTAPILFMAGPWLDAKIKSGFIHPETNQKITTDMAIIPILEHFNYKIAVFCVGASRNSLLPHLGQLPEKNLFCLHNSDNFTPLLSKISDLNVNIVATFPPNAGNGSTNSQVAHSGLPAVFLYPNDSEAMAPEFFFARSIKDYHATIFKLFHSPDFRQSYMYKSRTELTRRTSHCLAHISELLNS